MTELNKAKECLYNELNELKEYTNKSIEVLNFYHMENNALMARKKHLKNYITELEKVLRVYIQELTKEKKEVDDLKKEAGITEDELNSEIGKYSILKDQLKDSFNDVTKVSESEENNKIFLAEADTVKLNSISKDSDIAFEELKKSFSNIPKLYEEFLIIGINNNPSDKTETSYTTPELLIKYPKAIITKDAYYINSYSEMEKTIKSFCFPENVKTISLKCSCPNPIFSFYPSPLFSGVTLTSWN